MDCPYCEIEVIEGADFCHECGLPLDEKSLPEPIGVFRAVDSPKYDVELNKQVAAAREKKGMGDLDALFNSGETWTVS